jgi:hypothetical protein
MSFSLLLGRSGSPKSIRFVAAQPTKIPLILLEALHVDYCSSKTIHHLSPMVLRPKKHPAYRGRSRGTLGDSPNLSDTIMRCDNLISSISLALEA